ASPPWSYLTFASAYFDERRLRPIREGKPRRVNQVGPVKRGGGSERAKRRSAVWGAQSARSAALLCGVLRAREAPLCRVGPAQSARRAARCRKPREAGALRTVQMRGADEGPTEA